MCDQPKIYRAKGKELVITTGAGSEITSFEPETTDGTIIGMAVSESYDRADLGKIFLTAEENDNKPLVNVPLTTLLAEGGRLYYPVNFKTRAISLTLESKTANSDAATKPVLTFFFSKEPQNCR